MIDKLLAKFNKHPQDFRVSVSGIGKITMVDSMQDNLKFDIVEKFIMVDDKSNFIAYVNDVEFARGEGVERMQTALFDYLKKKLIEEEESKKRGDALVLRMLEIYLKQK